MRGWQYYQTKTLAVVPYMAGTPVYVDGMLSHLYYKTRDEGKIEKVFCGDVLNHDRFVSFFEARKTLQVLCEVRDNQKLNPVGYSWVDNPKGVEGARSAMCGFCFFREGRKSCVNLGRLGIAYWMEDMMIDTIHGVMLESNEPARRYAQRLGFIDFGVVPDYHYNDGRLEGARVVYLRKQEFVPEFSEWFAKQIPVEP